MTRDEIIYHRRVSVLEHAAETGNVAETCWVFGISRKTFYEWQRIARAYGLEALMPKDRRKPQLPNATPTPPVLSDNGPEYNALRFRDHLGELDITHVRIPPRSPNHNAVCERF